MDMSKWNGCATRPPMPPPHIPPSLGKLLMKYHRGHSNSFRLVHHLEPHIEDIIPMLTDYFQHIHVSAPDREKLRETRDRLKAYHADNWWKSKLTFSVTEPEEMDECVVAGSVDMVLSVMAPWTDVEHMVQSAANSLTPNGTLALIHVHPICKALGNERLGILVEAMFERWRSALYEADKALDSTDKKGILQCSNGLDFVPLPEHLFIQQRVTKRININSRGREHAFSLVKQDAPFTTISRRAPNDRAYEFATGEDTEAEGWQMEVDAVWLSAYFRDLTRTYDIEQGDNRIREFERLAFELSPSGKIMLEWMVAILLATRTDSFAGQ